MDLKSKLGIYSKSAKAPEKNEPSKLEPLRQGGGEEIVVPAGKIWRYEHRLSNEIVYDEALANVERKISSFLRLNGHDETLTLEDLLFFDLETTSLSIGAGSYAFVVGIGYVDENDFVVEQLFMESYGDEIAILEYLLDFFVKSKAVVSFNGNTFDLPLIKNRYMINRIYGFPVDIVKIDLIVPSRRIFKSLFDSCSLQTLEKCVLGYERIDDTPGWMIPEIYFSFQKDGNPERIPGVIEHNRFDIHSMYVLLLVLNTLFQNIEERSYGEFEKSSLYNLARYLYRVDSKMFLDLAEYLGSDIIGDKGVFERFSITLKRKGEWERAIEYWEASASLFSLIELAKYYEHKDKQLEKALSYCNRAIKILGEGDEDPVMSGRSLKEKEALEKRKVRLEEKINRLGYRADSSL